MKYIIIILLFLLTCTSTHAKQRIAVIDTGLNLNDKRFQSILCTTGHKDFTGTGIKDNLGHGTHILGLIKKYAKDSDYCVIILKYYNIEDESMTGYRSFLAFEEAIRQNVTMVNYSSSGREFIEREYLLMKHHPNIIFVVAAGNEDVNLDKIKVFPASYNLDNIITVGSLNKRGDKLDTSNYGSVVKAWEVGESVYSTYPNGRVAYMSGTSQATAIRCGKLVNRK